MQPLPADPHQPGWQLAHARTHDARHQPVDHVALTAGHGLLYLMHEASRRELSGVNLKGEAKPRY